MTGKTHLAVGVATAIVVTQPTTIGKIVLCIGAASIGSVISDVDVSTSDSHEYLNKIIGIIVMVSIIVALIEYKWHIGIVKTFLNSSNGVRSLIGIAAFIGICVFGENRPHRSFMHSFLAVVLLSVCTYFMLPAAVPYFAVAMISHMIIDTLNHKKVLLLYPLHFGVSFGVCSAEGLVNHMIFIIASIITIVEITRLVS